MIGCAPLRLVGFLGQLDCPYPELLDYLRLRRILHQSAAFPCLLVQMLRIMHRASSRKIRGALLGLYKRLFISEARTFAIDRLKMRYPIICASFLVEQDYFFLWNRITFGRFLTPHKSV